MASMGPIRPRRIEADGRGGVDRYKWDEAGTQAPRRHSASGRCARDGSPLSRSRQARRWHCDADALSRGHNRLHHCRSWAWNCRAWPATVVSRAYRRRSGSSSVSTFNRGLPLSGRPRPLAPMLRPQFGLAFVRPDRLARFGGLCHLGLRSAIEPGGYGVRLGAADSGR